MKYQSGTVMRITGMLKYDIAAVAVLMLAASCRDVQEYVPQPRASVVAELTAPAGCGTRSSLPDDIGNRIMSVTWAAYSQGSGALMCTGFLQPEASGSCMVTMDLPEGRTYDIYAIANAGDLRDRIPVGDDMVPELDLILSDEFSDLAATGLPMAGRVCGARAGGERIEIPMKSLVASFLVDVNVKGLDLELSPGEFKRVMQGEYIHVRNSNRHLTPFSDSGSRARSAEDVCRGDTDASFCAIVPLPETLPQSTDSVFSYMLYVPENMQGILLPGNDDPDNKIPSEVDRACGQGTSDRLTYLEFSFSKTEAADSNPFTGEIIFRMYLGRDNCRDFTIEGGTVNTLCVAFDADVMLQPPTWKADHGETWNNGSERLEFSSHDLTVTPSSSPKLFVWYSGTGVSLAEAIPRYMGILSPDRVKAAVRDEWYFEEDTDSPMPGFADLWASDPVSRLHSDAIRYVASNADKAGKQDVVGRYYFKFVDSMMGKTAMLVVSDRWHYMRDTCYVHFSGEVKMNSSDFNNFRVAQQRTLEVTGLPAASAATCEATYGKDLVAIEEYDAGAGSATKKWRIKALGVGNVGLKVQAGGVSALFTVTVLPVYLGFMRLEGGIACSLDGTHSTCSYAYYSNRECTDELSEGSFLPELKSSLLAPCLALEGQYAPLLTCNLSGRQITTFISSYSSGAARLEGFRGDMYMATLSLSPAYCPTYVSKAGIRLKSYRSYDVMGRAGTLSDASGYERKVLAKVPGGLPREYSTHAEFGGHASFRKFSGSPMVNASAIGRNDLWSVGLYTGTGEECTSVAIRNYTAEDVWTGGSPEGQTGGVLTARLKVRNRNSGEVFEEDLFKMDCAVLVCIAGAYCNETGIYGRSSFYEVPKSERPRTFYNSVTGATDLRDGMILMQRDEWKSFSAWDGKIRRYLLYADDFIGTPANAYLGKTKYTLSAGLCFDTYADSLGCYSDKVRQTYGTLASPSSRFITGTVERRYSYVEFDSSAATQLVILWFHPSLYFSLLAYHADDSRPACDMRKRKEVCTSSHFEGVDDHLLLLSQTRPYALRTQVQHVFYGDVEDGRCNDQPWRVDFNYRSPSSLANWAGDTDKHVPYSPDGDSSVDELIGQFAPELAFSTGAYISGMSFKGRDADYVSSDGTHLKLFFLHDVLNCNSTAIRYTWKNWY